jgi:archaeosine-15-forming tRNA-guanine transglycosylase
VKIRVIFKKMSAFFSGRKKMSPIIYQFGLIISSRILSTTGKSKFKKCGRIRTLMLIFIGKKLAGLPTKKIENLNFKKAY